jgi:penicillin-binding protein 1B
MDRSALAPAALRLCLRSFLAKAQSRKSQSQQPDRKGRRKGFLPHHRRKSRTVLRYTLAASLVVLVSLTVFFIHSYRSYAKIVDERLAHGYLTSRAGIYAAPRKLRRGQKLTRDGLAAALRRAGYIESDEATEVWNGTFTAFDRTIEIRPNTGESHPTIVRVEFDRLGRISELTGDDLTLDSFALAPESLTNDALTKGAVRRQLTFKDIPPVLVHAITSIEDRRFFEHHGLDVFGVARAVIRNAGDERIGQGGSSITQQLVKNTYLTPERSFRRKYAEAMLAFSLERRLSKEDIFSLYCSEVYLGHRQVLAVRGVEQAARVFFGKELKDLRLTEAATIAGMIQSPSRYSPVRHSDDARMRRNTVLGTMVRDGHITLEQAANAAKEPLLLADFDPSRESAAPYFIDHVSRYRTARGSERVMADEPQTGMPALPEVAPIITTLDLDLQRLATDAIKKQLARLDEIYKPRGLTPQAALVALDPKTGEILAMVGGRDYVESQLNRATDAQRQPGSVFKPFVYAAALESGISPLRKFTDAPREFVYDNRAKYHPANYGGGFSMRDVSLRTGLIKSLNVVTVDVAMQTGLARTANIVQAFGLPRPVPYPALALGTTEATPLQMAAAYAVFANGGKKVQPQITKPSDDLPLSAQVIQPSTAFIVTDMLEGVIDHGTARAARGQIQNTAVAGKTGTSRDGWFVGYTPNLVCAVWIGFDDNQQLGMTGADAALPAWLDFMKGAVDLRPELGGKAFEQPDEISFVEIDSETNQLATGICPQHERVAVLSTQAPTSECYRHNVYFDFSNDSDAEAVTMAKTEPSRLPKKRESGELASLRDTRVDTDTVGRRILVNEMRAVGR